MYGSKQNILFALSFLEVHNKKLAEMGKISNTKM